MPKPSRPSPRKQRPAKAKETGAVDSLAEIQGAITQELMRPLGRGDRIDPAATETAQALIRPNTKLTALERLQIYSQQYWWRLRGNFSEDFRGLRAVLGERKFNHLATAYIQHHGSTSWNLRDLGQHIEAYLLGHPELTAPHEQLALDMARVEWARIEAFDGPAKPTLNPQKIAHIAPDRLQLKLQPYISLLSLEYPIDDLLGRLKRREIQTDSLSNAVSGQQTRRRLRLSARPAHIHLAVHRVDYIVYYKRLDAAAYRLLKAIAGGASLEAACEIAMQGTTVLPESFAAKVQTWFANWMSLGWLYI